MSAITVDDCLRVIEGLLWQAVDLDDITVGHLAEMTRARGRAVRAVGDEASASVYDALALRLIRTAA